MVRITKDARDIYYRRGKASGYRARSAFKLLQLDDTYHFLGGGDRPYPQAVVDLCAAPGSWSQVVRERLPSSSPIVAVDLQIIAPIPGVTTICGDITTEETMEKILSTLAALLGNPTADASAELVVCDGAPDVTGLHDLDEYLQAQLVCAALSTALRLLKPSGTFVCKMFTSSSASSTSENSRSQSTRGVCEHARSHPLHPGLSASLLQAQLRTCFSTVDIIKPRSSRDTSAEHFIVAQGKFSDVQLSPDVTKNAYDPVPLRSIGDLSMYDTPVVADPE